MWAPRTLNSLKKIKINLKSIKIYFSERIFLAFRIDFLFAKTVMTTRVYAPGELVRVVEVEDEHVRVVKLCDGQLSGRADGERPGPHHPVVPTGQQLRDVSPPGVVQADVLRRAVRQHEVSVGQRGDALRFGPAGELADEAAVRSEDLHGVRVGDDDAAAVVDGDEAGRGEGVARRRRCVGDDEVTAAVGGEDGDGLFEDVDDGDVSVRRDGNAARAVERRRVAERRDERTGARVQGGAVAVDDGEGAGRRDGDVAWLAAAQRPGDVTAADGERAAEAGALVEGDDRLVGHEQLGRREEGDAELLARPRPPRPRRHPPAEQTRVKSERGGVTERGGIVGRRGVTRWWAVRRRRWRRVPRLAHLPQPEAVARLQRVRAAERVHRRLRRAPLAQPLRPAAHVAAVDQQVEPAVGRGEPAGECLQPAQLVGRRLRRRLLPLVRPPRVGVVPVDHVADERRAFLHA